MNTKLTLSIDKVLRKRIKEYAKEHDTKISFLVARYFKALLGEKQTEKELTPLVKELMGVIPSDYTEEDMDKMYKKHLEEKYL